MGTVLGIIKTFLSDHFTNTCDSNCCINDGEISINSLSYTECIHCRKIEEILSSRSQTKSIKEEKIDNSHLQGQTEELFTI